jgi:hypothetical protein
MKLVIYNLSIIYLNSSSQFDGDDDGGSLFDLLLALDKIWFPLIGLVILIYLINSSLQKSSFFSKDNSEELKRLKKEDEEFQEIMKDIDDWNNNPQMWNPSCNVHLQDIEINDDARSSADKKLDSKQE